MSDVDLEEAGAAVRALPVEPPTPVTELHRRRRYRRTRRLAIVTGLSALAAASVAVGAAVAVSSRPSSRVATLSPARIGHAIVLPTVPHPRGWRQIDYGRLRLWVPHRWDANQGPYGCTDTGGVVLTFAPNLACGRQSYNYFTLRPSKPPPPRTWRSSTIHGLRVWSQRTKDTTTLVVPHLQVRITARGTEAMAAVRTLGPSPLEALLTLHHPVTVPTSWTAVTFHGFTLDVPTHWKIQPAPTDGWCASPFLPGTPIVSTGEPTSNMLCPQPGAIELQQPNNGLWLQDVTTSTSARRESGLRMHHLDITIVPVLGQPIANLTATYSGRTLHAQLGLGPQPLVLEEIVSSLRIDL